MVIAILAAISIVAYNGIQNRGYDSAVRSDLRNMAAKMQEYKILHNETPPEASQAGLEEIVSVAKGAYLSRSNSSLVYCRTDDSFALIAQSKSGQAFVMENGSTRTIGNWGGSNDNAACGVNATIGLRYNTPAGSQPGYAHYWLLRDNTWRDWIAG